MSEDNQVVDQQQEGPSPEVIREARNMGWAPQDKWKGDPKEWINADEFIERNKTFIPVLRANNQKLEAELRETRGMIAQQAESLRSANAAIAALEESQTEATQVQAEEALEEIERQIEEASTNGEHRQVAKLTRKMVELQTSMKGADGKGGKEDKADPPARPRIPPEVVNWFEEHPEFKEPRRAALANAIADELRKKGDTRLGREFLDDVATEVNSYLGENPGAGASRVSGDNGGSRRSNGGSGGGGKTYADLPADARAACNKMASKFVGEGKKYKTEAAWQKSYATKYFEQE